MLKRKRRKENKEIRTKNRKGAPGREKGPQVVTWRPGSGRAFAPARKLVRGVPALALQARASGSQTPVWERICLRNSVSRFHLGGRNGVSEEGVPKPEFGNQGLLRRASWSGASPRERFGLGLRFVAGVRRPRSLAFRPEDAREQAAGGFLGVG